MKPTLPKNNDPQAASKYRNDLHEDLYPNNLVFVPVTSGFTSSGVTGSIVRMGRLNVVSVVLSAPVVITSGYFDLPFSVSQAASLQVAANGAAYSGVVGAGSNRVYLPTISPIGEVVISGIVVGG